MQRVFSRRARSLANDFRSPASHPPSTNARAFDLTASTPTLDRSHVAASLLAASTGPGSRLRRNDVFIVTSRRRRSTIVVRFVLLARRLLVLVIAVRPRDRLPVHHRLRQRPVDDEPVVVVGGRALALDLAPVADERGTSNLVRSRGKP
jgi:hypothetical protein